MHYLKSIALIALLPLTACTTGNRMAFLETTHEPYAICNVQSRDFLPKYTRRVLLLPISHPHVQSHILDYLDQTFLTELIKTHRFETLQASRQDLYTLFGEDHFTSTSPLPPQFFEILQQHYQADAVLFVDITAYRPYQPLELGIRSKLIDITNKRTLWTADDLLNAGNPQVRESARIFNREHQRKPYPVGYQEITLNSPRDFSQYAAHAIFATIPPHRR